MSHFQPSSSFPFAPHPSAPHLSLSHASRGIVAVDPELQPLTDALVALKIGVHRTCAALAVALEQAGVMSIDDLRLLSEVDARDLLDRVGFEKLQQIKLMQAVAPPLAASSFTLSLSTPALSSRPPECDWAALKKDGFSARELRLTGCDLSSAQAVGYDARSLMSAFGYDAVVAAGCDVSSCVLASHTPALLHVHTKLTPISLSLSATAPIYT